MIEKLNAKLDKAISIKDSADRIAAIGAVIAEALRSRGQDPILVGGAAVEFFTRGGYSTEDLDFVTEGGVEVTDVMQSLGFEKIGKDFVDRKRGLYIEFPSGTIAAGEKFYEIDVDGVPLRIISCEDLVVDRLNAFKFWKSALDGINALLLLEMNSVDEKRLVDRAKSENVFDALNLVQTTREKIIRKKLSRSAASELLERRMRSL